jgi:putative glutamine amidotransferase
LSASKPLIGLTTYRQRAQSGVWDVEAAFLPSEYFECVSRAGGTAVLVPPQPIDSDAAARIVAGLDGLIVCGGRDVDPALYGQEPGAHTDKPDTRRDETERALYQAAIDAGLPFLGICRGQQVLNTLRGGTLIQHLPDVVGSNKYQLGNGVYSTAEINVVAGTSLSSALGGDPKVLGALYHHQAIDKVGHGLSVVARSADGIVEAVELDGYPFGLAVQWHPEHTPEDNRLFEALVSAAASYRSSK